MGTKVKETCTVLSQECIGKDIYSMWIQTKTIAGNAKPGQFVSVYTQDGSKLLPRPISAVLGYRDELFLNEEFEKNGEVYLATEDGSAGTKGNVMDAIRENDLEADVIFACGPKPMLRAIKAYAQEKGIPCWISMEERMACGIGACLGCVCQSTEVDAHSHVHNKRVCKDGPVFRSTEVEL